MLRKARNRGRKKNIEALMDGYLARWSVRVRIDRPVPLDRSFARRRTSSFEANPRTRSRFFGSSDDENTGKLPRKFLCPCAEELRCARRPVGSRSQQEPVRPFGGSDRIGARYRGGRELPFPRKRKKKPTAPLPQRAAAGRPTLSGENERTFPRKMRRKPGGRKKRQQPKAGSHAHGTNAANRRSLPHPSPPKRKKTERLRSWMSPVAFR
mmetsp:Transcript_10216/g.24821  ORF Transcript_10216/g.24821 Transcript_10216/m.24821 type:complete len:210 (-) Transcript_10216:209-838(-)